ncbi:uncharacterized protein BO80DRAFT_116284 [Aspergillus ibericus CBS 121593]|uniref:Uncharacterized protein n=1 Tax=Aspergillus ibericus CBS 121593 TaxID=1448316 RepID=A0A395GXI7_9EURO|nr:hypothetical protein BO80DRAFT_116284 [Aspergillus ibericus CBS 121593]RAK99804.1 hypothetical protein BO80DRAFT_116284 [Aspergillus ibericus CBS 121593]
MRARANWEWAPFPDPKRPSGLTRTTLIRDSSDDMIRGQTGNTSTGIQSGPVSRTRRRPSPRRSLADPSTCKILISHCSLHLSLSLLFFFFSIPFTSASTSSSLSLLSSSSASDSPAPWPSTAPSRPVLVLGFLSRPYCPPCVRDPCNVTLPEYPRLAAGDRSLRSHFIFLRLATRLSA